MMGFVVMGAFQDPFLGHHYLQHVYISSRHHPVSLIPTKRRIQCARGSRAQNHLS